MIRREELIQIGQIIKPHGLQGELAFSFTSDIFDEIQPEFFICEIDGIMVPFFVENYRFKNDEIGLVKFEGINSDEEAKDLIKAPIYLQKAAMPQDVSAQEIEGILYYKGFSITDENGILIGKIEEVDDSSENILFLVEKENGDEIYIPASDEYIVEIDDKKRTMKMDLPEGLLDL